MMERAHLEIASVGVAKGRMSVEKYRRYLNVLTERAYKVREATNGECNILRRKGRAL